MKLIAEPAVISGLWDALQEPARPPRTVNVARLAAHIVQRGWAYGYEIADLMAAMGLGWWWERADLNTLFGLPTRTIFNAPRRSSTSCSGGDATVAVDVAAMALMIEQLGAEIDPMPIVEEVLPTLAGKDLLTASEVAVLWSRRERHRLPPAWVDMLGAPKHLSLGEPVRLPSGYRAVAGQAGEAIVQIYVARPSRRRRLERVDQRARAA